MTLKDALKQFEKKSISSGVAFENIRFLVMELSGYSPTEFYLRQEQPLPDMLYQQLKDAVMKHIDEHVPVQHLLGFAYFYGYRFKVNEHVLIPRRETEELVEHVLAYYDTYFDKKHVKVLDLGTGSGCIAVTLALEEDHMDVFAYDLSEEALKVAKENSKILDGVVSFGQSNWFTNVVGKFDIIVANPPYIPDDEKLEAQVLKEPHLALFGGIEGINHYETILKEAPAYLNEKGLIAFEHGYQQKEMIRNCIKKHLKDAAIVQLKDLQGKDRMTFIGTGGVLK